MFEGNFTNIGDFRVIGGSIESKAEFHNAGHMQINDIYSDTDTTCNISFDDKLINDSNWIEYNALVSNEDAFYRAVQKQNEKINLIGDNDETTGYEIYSSITVCNSMEINSNVTINRANLWVEENQYNDSTNEVTPIVVINNATITLRGSTLNVHGKLINKGTMILCLSNQEFHGSNSEIQVWPRGIFTHDGELLIFEGTINRMDDLKPDANGIKVVEAIINGMNAN